MDLAPQTALLAVDLADARATFDLARPWIERRRVATDLLYVAPEPGPDDRSTLWELLGELSSPLRGRPVIAGGARVAEEIVTRAAGHSVLMVGTHGRTGLAQAWLGSVAERVVRTSPVPTLVLRKASLGARVLVAVEPEHHPEALIAEGGRWAGCMDCRVDVLHASHFPHTADAGGGAGAELLIEAWLEGNRWLEGHLGTLLAALPDESRGACRVEIGEAAEVVVREATAYGLVVVGTHGRKGPERFWLGSVAERIVRRSPVPVLVVPLAG